MTCGLNEEQIFILSKICFKNRWCKKHISKEDLISGIPKDKCKIYSNAIEELVRKGYLLEYVSMGRRDICVPKYKREELLNIFKAHKGEYDFIKPIEYIK